MAFKVPREEYTLLSNESDDELDDVVELLSKSIKLSDREYAADKVSEVDELAALFVLLEAAEVVELDEFRILFRRLLLIVDNTRTSRTYEIFGYIISYFGIRENSN